MPDRNTRPGPREFAEVAHEHFVDGFTLLWPDPATVVWHRVLFRMWGLGFKGKNLRRVGLVATGKES